MVDLRQPSRQRTETTPAQLDRYCHLDIADLDLVEVRRGDHNRLGFAVQLGMVRFLGTLLPGPTDVLDAVVAYVADQLAVHPAELKGCAARRSTQWEHAAPISQAYGYRDFTDPQVQTDLTGWLTGRP